ncbi:hypothetical protein ACTXKZ_05355 [Brachybacterium alimentarium]|uniref:hypothetical protein n=1 Tax=Brachybacterium alimentarium TaxID=47845 RepID=UPI003FD35D12
MRFERIFDDLEGRFEHQEREEMRAVAEDLARAERAQLSLADRLRGAGRSVLTLHVGTDLRLEGLVEEVGEAWVALRDPENSQRAVIPMPAVSLVQGLPARARPAEESLLSPLGLGSVLRAIARDRSIVRLETAAGRIMGRIAAVGADSLDVQSLPTGEHGAVPGSVRVTVAMAALLAVIPR